MKPRVIGIAGRIGSGKSTLAIHVHQLLGGVLVSFGDFVREEARRRNLSDSRESLQELGESLIAEHGWDGFCQDVLVHFDWTHRSTAVIDGVRHVEVVQSLRTLIAPSQFMLVFVRVDENTRQCRLLDEGLPGENRLARIEAHSTEYQVPHELFAIADMIVNGSEPAPANARAIIERISEGQEFEGGP